MQQQKFFPISDPQDKGLTTLLVEAQDALDAIRHHGAGLRPGVDPLREVKRLHDALEAA